MKIELDLTHYQACLLGRALGEWKEAYGNRDYKELASALHEALAKVGIDKSKFFPRAPEPPKKEEPEKFYVDEDKRVWMRVGAPTWSVHNCNSKAHIKCLEEAERTKDSSGYGTIFVGEFFKESDPELALSAGQMKELFDNLVMEGFTKGEAARIVGIVARG